MALRPIDNALLPPTPDRARSKKLLKISVQTQPKQPDYLLTGNDKDGDEVHPPTTATADPAAIDYISSADLSPFTDPEAKIQGVVEGLESKDWLQICESLNDVRVFAIHHPTLLQPFLEKVLLVLVKSMKNPRSALCKTSIMASSDLFSTYSDQLLQPTCSDAFDQLQLQLLLKASQDKRFLCEEAEKSLNAMVHSVSPIPLLHKLKDHVRHTNLRVRAKAAVSISNCVMKMKSEELDEFGPVSLVKMGAELLNDRLPEAREAARSMVLSLYNSFILDPANEEQESWQNFCMSNLSSLHALSIMKITIPQKNDGSF